MKNAKRFEATLERGDRALGWTIARIPFDPREAWAELIRLRVSGEINGFPFRTSLFAAEEEKASKTQAPAGYYLLINRAMQQAAGVALGQLAQFTLAPDFDPRPAELPDQLAMLLDDEPGLRAWYDRLSEYTRREIGKWLLGVKSEPAQASRAMQMAERLLSTMEAEHELPPLIATALRRRPKSAAGWARMNEAQRRRELMAVFYYQTPDARAKRVTKLCDTAEKRAEP